MLTVIHVHAAQIIVTPLQMGFSVMPVWEFWDVIPPHWRLITDENAKVTVDDTYVGMSDIPSKLCYFLIYIHAVDGLPYFGTSYTIKSSPFEPLNLPRMQHANI